MPDVILDPNSPVVMTGNVGQPEVLVTVDDSATKPLEITCADGTVVEIKPGKSKAFFQHKLDVRFHLLDCPCETCVKTKGDAEVAS